MQNKPVIYQICNETMNMLKTYASNGNLFKTVIYRNYNTSGQKIITEIFYRKDGKIVDFTNEYTYDGKITKKTYYKSNGKAIKNILFYYY